MERKEAIRGAYRLTGGNNFYDSINPFQHFPKNCKSISISSLAA